MNSKIISLKIRDGEPLFVVKTRLIAESRMFRYLIDELNYDELEMDDFSPEAVNLFITILLEEFQRTILIKHDLFRDTHKLAVVFEVDWIKSDCQNILREEMKSIKSYEDTCFLFDECYYIYSKWKERNLIDSLTSSLVRRENSLFISRYMSDLRKITTGQINILLTIGGSNTDLFLKILLKNIEKSKYLSGKMKHLLNKINLAFSCEQNVELYLSVFDAISDSSEISLQDMQFTHQIRSETARMMKSRMEKLEKKRERYDIVSHDKSCLDAIKCKNFSDIVDRISEGHVTSMFIAVQLLLDLYPKHKNKNLVDGINVRKFVTNLEQASSGKPIQKISKEYLNTLIEAIDQSIFPQSEHALALLRKIKNSKNLSTFHENIIIKQSMAVTEDEDGFTKEVFTFSHPANVKICEMAGRCGFILKVRQDKQFRAYNLTTDLEDYTETNRHYHYIIKAQDMFRYTAMTGKTKDGTTIRAVGRWTKWWEKWFPGSHATTRFLRKGGAEAPPKLFKGGAFLRKRGAKFFSSVHCRKN